jgi:GWxTD domain-containing protein
VRQAEAVRNADARLAAGDTLSALAVVREVQERDGNTAGLERIRLVAERTGAGLRRYPPPARRRLVVRTARRLLQLDPMSPLALETIADDAVATVLFFRDRGARLGLTMATTPAESSPRLRGSRFDLGQRSAVAPLVDRTGPARDAARRASPLLDSLLAVDPARAAPYVVALAVAEQRWGRLDTLAAALRGVDLTAAALASGLAAWRTGRTAAAGPALSVGLAGLPPAERARFDDLTPLLSPDSLAAYLADRDAFAQRFWEREDPRRITVTSERRLEHLARVLEADALFGRPLGDLFSEHPRRGAETDRGRVWVRYGRPDREAGFTPTDAAPAYDGDELAAFVVWEYDEVQDGTRFVFDDAARSGRYRTYSPPASAYATPTGRASSDDYVTQDRILQRDAPESFADTLALSLPLVVARFRSASGQPEAVVAFEVPPYARAAVFVDDRRVAEGGAAVVGLASTPTTIRAEWVAEAPERFAAAEAQVEPLSEGFGLSDVMLVGGDGAGVMRRGERIIPLIADTLARAARLSVYAEVYGLALRDGRTDAEAEVGLVPAETGSGLRRMADRLFGRRPAGVATAIELQGSTATDALLLALDASGLPSGRYRLVLRVADRIGGQEAESSREIVLRE